MNQFIGVNYDFTGIGWIHLAHSIIFCTEI